MATHVDSYRLLTAEEFLRIDFGEGLRAELDDGVIRIMAGGSRAHALVQANFMQWLGAALRGTGCRPYGPDAAVRTTAWSVRYPDVTVDCGSRDDPETELKEKVLDAPRVIIEVLSPGTQALDEDVKLPEYRRMFGVDTIVLVDPRTEVFRVLHRFGAGEWSDRTCAERESLDLPSLGLLMPHAEIFARD